MKVFELNINMDAECWKCGRKGATDSGFCLKCIAGKVKDLQPKQAPSVRWSKKPKPLNQSKKRTCQYTFPGGKVCGKRTGNGGANMKYCDTHHKAVSNTCGVEGI